MSKAYPYAGSTYSYTQRAIHPNAGFLAGWGIYMDYVLVPLIVMMMGAAYCTSLVPQVPYQVFVVIIGLIIFFVNYRGIKVTASVNNILVLYMAVVVVVFLIFGIRYLLGGGGEGTIISIKPFYNAATFAPPLIFSGAALACFSFLGFDSITTLSEEAVNPKKDIGRAAMLACFFGGLIFIIQAYVAQLAFPDWTKFENLDTAFFDVVSTVGGSLFAVFFTAAIIVSTLTAGLTGQASAARVMFAMGRDEMLPKKFFAHLHPKYGTPTNNIMIMTVISIVAGLFIPIETVAELMNFGALFGFMFVNLSVFAQFFVRQRERNVLTHLIIPFLGFLICGYLWINLSTTTLIVGFSWLALGFVYLAISTKGFKSYKQIYEAE
jgi:amino acid transporter